MKKVAMVAQMGVMKVLAIWTSAHEGWPGYSPCWEPSLPAETNTEPLVWHHSLGWSASYLMTDWLLWIASITEEAWFCSYWNRHLFWIQICLPSMQFSAKTTICGLTKHLIHCHGIPHIIASDRGTNFPANEVQPWTHAHGILWSYYILYLPEAAGLIER